MNLMTLNLERELKNYPLYSQEGKKENADIICKFFSPIGGFTWYVLEAEKQENDYCFFGLAVNNEQEKEYGYFMLSQLKNIRLPFGLKIERDIYFKKCKISELNKQIV